MRPCFSTAGPACKCFYVASAALRCLPVSPILWYGLRYRRTLHFALDQRGELRCCLFLGDVAS